MAFQQIACAIVCVFVSVASAPANAQSLSVTVASDMAPVTIDQIVPNYSSNLGISQPVAVEGSAAKTSSASKFASAAHGLHELPFSLETPAELDATISSAVTTKVIFRSPRNRVADFAMRLRDVRYVRGGHDPVTGFDCSGFTHYVYNQTYGLNLPYDAPGQYRDGKTIPRDRMRTGDLVFFQVGKRITHVGIYLQDGQFIHSPRPGKSVRVDSLDNAYWAKRFAGAKRPEVIS
jgi:cell wall-associated NlpC family hydrolase